MARPISDKYRRRIAAVGRETLTLRSQARGVLKSALQQATQEQLYDRTPLHVSRALYQSIKTRFAEGGVEVFFDASVAPYVGKRLSMKGISPSGGHLLDMQPGPTVTRKSRAQLLALARAAHRRILDGQ